MLYGSLRRFPVSCARRFPANLMGNIYVMVFVSILTMAPLLPVLASTSPNSLELPVPSAKQAFPTQTFDLASFHIEEQAVFIATKKEKAFIHLDLSKKQDPARPFQFSRKYRVTQKTPHLNRIAPARDGFIVLDHSELIVHYFSKKFAWVSSHSLVYDKIRPPEDRLGEATHKEIADLRSQFIAKVRKLSSQSKIAGIAILPATWQTSDTFHSYFLSSHIEDFPLLIMQCQKELPSRCNLTRACFLSGSRPPAAAITGIGVEEDSRRVLFGNKVTNEIWLYDYQSCYRVLAKHKLKIPPRLYTLTDVKVSDDGALWISTSQIDDYMNANLYLWPKEVWEAHLDPVNKNR